MRKYWLCLLIFFVLVGCTSQKPVDQDPEDEIIEETPEEKPEEPQEDFLRFYLNGSQVKDQTTVAVMAVIENTEFARPQSGLSVADVVYEVAMEKYSTTRFLAVFSSVLPDKVGPMRSARIPFVKLAKGWLLPFAHYGAAKTGEGDAYSLIKSIRWPIRFDGVSGLNDSWFFRDQSRRSPHNAYFDAKSASQKMPEITLEHGFSYSEESPSGDKAVTLDLALVESVKVRYVYDDSQKKYMRWINSQPMTDAYNQQQVSVSNVIVLEAKHQLVTSTQYVLVDFSQVGDMLVFSGGTVRRGTWKMVNSVIQYLDDAGEPILLMPGNTWVQIVSSSMKVTYE